MSVSISSRIQFSNEFVFQFHRLADILIDTPTVRQGMPPRDAAPIRAANAEAVLPATVSANDVYGTACATVRELIENHIIIDDAER